jgi:hypothetical protein
MHEMTQAVLSDVCRGVHLRCVIPPYFSAITNNDYQWFWLQLFPAPYKLRNSRRVWLWLQWRRKFELCYATLTVGDRA